jgi:hypothetical protein
MEEKSGSGCRYETITQLRAANELMDSANRALALGDLNALYSLGFSQEHICELQERGGFRSSSLAQNTRLINRLLKEAINAH